MESKAVRDIGILKAPRGLIAKIEPFAIHDGPGIRTVIFMKGCPLRCLWCSSPQTQEVLPEVLNDTDKCRKCGTCMEVCPKGAIQRDGEGLIRIARGLCDGCGLCAVNCPYQALESAGKYYGVDELFREIEKDSLFYRRSNGGVTISGGEPTLQAAFVAALLRQCRQQHIHTVMETCGFAPWGKLEPLLSLLNLVYFDIKHMDENTHKKLTGVSNRVILRNIKTAAGRLPMCLRIPVVPGLNDDDGNISATARFARELGDAVIRVELLPFHKLGEDLYRKIGKAYLLHDVCPPADETVARLKDKIESYGLKCRIGG